MNRGRRNLTVRMVQNPDLKDNRYQQISCISTIWTLETAHTQIIQDAGNVFPSHQTITIPIQHLKRFSQLSDPGRLQSTQRIPIVPA